MNTKEILRKLDIQDEVNSINIQNQTKELWLTKTSNHNGVVIFTDETINLTEYFDRY